MIHKVFSIFDSKAEAYFQPFFSKNVNTAIRSVTDAVNDPQTQFSQHPQDYILFQLGEYDDNTGILTSDLQSFGVLIEYKHTEV